MSYDVTLFQNDDAINYGVNAAILLYKIRGFLQWAKSNNKHNHEGRYWTYNSISAWKNLAPFLSEKQIVTALKILKEAKIIITGNFNKNKYDRTTWYSILGEEFEAKISPKHEDLPGESITPKGQMDYFERPNQFSQMGEPIPNNTTKNTAVGVGEHPTSTTSDFERIIQESNLTRLNATGWLKKIKAHFGTVEAFNSTVGRLADLYCEKKPYRSIKHDDWIKDRVDFIEKAIIKEIKK